MVIADFVLLAVFAVPLLAGAYQDWRYRRLPNALCLATFAVGVGATFAMQGPLAAGMAVIHSLLALLMGMFLFSRGWIGGGDAKFYAGAAAWFPLAAGWLLILCVSLAGLLLLIAWFPFRHTLATVASGQRDEAEYRKLPYGVAIAAGSWVTLLVMRAA